MTCLDNALDYLLQDLISRPIRIAAHSDMPFAIFRYAPGEEFPLRKKLRLLATKLAQEGDRKATFLSLSRIVWDTATEFDLDDLYKTEEYRGFDAAQLHLNRLLSSTDFHPAADSIADKIRSFNLNKEQDVIFLVRAGAVAPAILRSSALLDDLHNRIEVPVVLFYPGDLGAGADLHFYSLPSHGNLGAYNYRVKIYGG